MRAPPLFSFLFAMSLLCPLYAFAQETAAAVSLLAFDPSDPGTVAKLLLDAVMNKQWGIVASLSVTALVAGVRRWVPEHTVVGKWFRTRLGGLVTNLVITLGMAFLTLFVAGGTFSLDLVIKALSVALGASGGWSVFKNITEAIAERKAQTAGTDAAEKPTGTLDQ